MPCFFFISSYFFFRGYKPELYKEKIKYRIYTLIIPYILWNILQYIVLVSMKRTTIGIKPFLKSFIFIYFPNTNEKIVCVNEPLWYIMRIMSYMIIDPIIYKICTNKKLFYTMLTIIILINLCFNTNYYSFIYWLHIFLTGAYVALNFKNKFEESLSNKFTNKYLAIIAIISFIIITLGFDYLYKYHDSHQLKYLIRTIAIFIIYFLSVLIPLKKAEVKSYIIQSPLYCYCGHALLITLLYPKFIRAKIFTNILQSYIAMVIVIISILYITFKIFKKFIPKILNVLTW